MTITWTLSEIRSKFRDLTGRPDTDQISDSDVNDKINAFYQYMFPYEADVHEFDGFTEETLSDGTGEYSLESTTLGVFAPVTIKDADGNIDEIPLYTDEQEFFTDYPDQENDEADEEGEPTACLVFNRTIYVRPVPDATYTAKFRSTSQLPTALTQDSHQPTDPKWGEVLAYGSAILYLNEQGDKDGADELTPMYKYHLASVQRKQILQMPVGQRARPSL